MMHMSKVLVILLNYNSPQDTYRCLHSLAKSSLPVQVVVVDNNSTNEGVMNQSKAQAIHSNTKVIFNARNDGFGAGNNIGIKWGLAHTEVDYFFILNNDTVVNIDCIRDLVSYLQEHSEAGMCSPAIFRFNEPDTYWFGGGFINWKKGGAISPNINRSKNDTVSVYNNTFITGCAMLIRREVLLQVGGFSKDFFMYSEDIDYCQRVLNAGYTISYVPNASILHDEHSSIMKSSGVFLPPHHWSNKNIEFVLKNIVYGTFLNLKKHSKGFEKFIGTTWVMLRYSKWCISYVVHFRITAIRAVLSGIKHSVLGRVPA